MSKKKSLKEKGFLVKDVGNKLDYGIFRQKVNEGNTLLGWMRKFCVKPEELEDGKFKICLDDNLNYVIS